MLAWDDIQAIRSVDAQRHVYGVGHDMIWLHLAPLAEEWLTYDLLVGGWRLVEALILGFMAFWLIAARKILISRNVDPSFEPGLYERLYFGWQHLCGFVYLTFILRL